MSVSVLDKRHCCGCSACVNICPKSCIDFTQDQLGFMYPKVDHNKCVECGLCEKVCQFNPDYDRCDNYHTPQVFAIRAKEQIELSRSQSGASFYLLSEVILEESGVVYGAGFDDNYRVLHKRAETPAQRDELRYSKYVQSDVVSAYKSVKTDLESGIPVMFTGTPCQVSGLRAYLRKQYQNLYTVDLVCHGVPSPKIWHDYLEYLKNKYSSELVEVKFRNKQYGWNSCWETFKFANGKFLKRTTSNDMYFAHLSVRESCSNCPYTNTNRVGDISVGDFWGWKGEEFNDNKGISLMFINSDNGKRLFDKIRDNADVVESNINDCLQPQLTRPISLHPRRDEFIDDYVNKGFLYVAKKYSDMRLKIRLRRFLSNLKQIIRKFLCRK